MVLGDIMLMLFELNFSGPKAPNTNTITKTCAITNYAYIFFRLGKNQRQNENHLTGNSKVKKKNRKNEIIRT